MLTDCKTGAEVFANYRAVRARMNALKAYEPAVPPVVIPIRQAGPVTMPVHVVNRKAELLSILERGPQSQPKYPLIRSIIHLVADAYGLEIKELLSQSRSVKVSRPRHVAMYLAKKYTLLSYPQISRKLMRADHTTSRHGYLKILEERKTDSLLDAQLAAIEVKLGVA